MSGATLDAGVCTRRRDRRRAAGAVRPHVGGQPGPRPGIRAVLPALRAAVVAPSSPPRRSVAWSVTLRCGLQRHQAGHRQRHQVGHPGDRPQGDPRQQVCPGRTPEPGRPRAWRTADPGGSPPSPANGATRWGTAREMAARWTSCCRPTRLHHRFHHRGRRRHRRRAGASQPLGWRLRQLVTCSQCITQRDAGPGTSAALRRCGPSLAPRPARRRSCDTAESATCQPAYTSRLDLGGRDASSNDQVVARRRLPPGSLVYSCTRPWLGASSNPDAFHQSVALIVGSGHASRSAPWSATSLEPPTACSPWTDGTGQRVQGPLHARHLADPADGPQRLAPGMDVGPRLRLAPVPPCRTGQIPGLFPPRPDSPVAVQR